MMMGCGGNGKTTDSTSTDNQAADADASTVDGSTPLPMDDSSPLPTGDSSPKLTGDSSPKLTGDSSPVTTGDSTSKDNVVRVPVDSGKTDATPRKDRDAIDRMILYPLTSYLSITDKLKRFQIKKEADLILVQGAPFKDADDFIKRVIEPLNIKLPQLPAGQKYVYDSKSNQLMVEKPTR